MMTYSKKIKVHDEKIKEIINLKWSCTLVTVTSEKIFDICFFFFSKTLLSEKT